MLLKLRLLLLMRRLLLVGGLLRSDAPDTPKAPDDVTPGIGARLDHHLLGVDLSVRLLLRGGGKLVLGASLWLLGGPRGFLGGLQRCLNGGGLLGGGDLCDLLLLVVDFAAGWGVLTSASLVSACLAAGVLEALREGLLGGGELGDLLLLVVDVVLMWSRNCFLVRLPPSSPNPTVVVAELSSGLK